MKSLDGSQNTRMMVDCLLNNIRVIHSANTSDCSNNAQSDLSASAKVGEGVKFGDNIKMETCLQSDSHSASFDDDIKNRSRKDLVRKTVFRHFKRHYTDLFAKEFDFRKRRRNKAKWSDLLVQAAKLFAVNNFDGCEPTSCATVIVAMVDPKNKFKSGGKTHSGLATQLNSLLRAFSVDKADQLMRIPAFTLMLAKYLDREATLCELIEGKADRQTRVAYESVTEELKERCHSYMFGKEY